jgi:hypothetical protein
LPFEFTGYLAGSGEPSRFQPGKDQFIINDNIEDTVFSCNQLRLYSEGCEKLLRQTGGMWFIVSNSTIMNFNVQILPPTVVY